MARTHSNHALLSVFLTVLSVASAAIAAEPDTLATPETTFGAAVAPALLPAGAASAYGFAGAPEVGGGYRQGLGPAELEVRGTFDYFLVAVAGELRARLTSFTVGPAKIAPVLGTGLVYDTGAEYIIRDNFDYLGIRALGGVVASYPLFETVRLLGEVELPIDFSVNPGGGTRVRPLAGAGAEVFLGGDLSAFAIGKLGGDFLKEPLGRTDGRVGFQLRVGLGWRLF